MRCELDLENDDVCLTPVINDTCPNENNHALSCFQPWLNVCKALNLDPHTAKYDPMYWIYADDLYWQGLRILEDIA